MNDGCGHEVGMLQIPMIQQQTKVRDVRAATMDGGGFAAGDLTLGGIAGAQVYLLDVVGLCGQWGIAVFDSVYLLRKKTCYLKMKR